MTLTPMKTDTLRTIETEIPDVFDRYDDWSWPDSIVVVGEDDLRAGQDPFEPIFLDSDDPAAPLDTEGAGHRLDPERLPDLDQVRSVLNDSFGPPDAAGDHSLREVLERLRENRGSRVWPGAPIDSQTERTRHVPPPPDAAAFYLPWHHFNENTWGIYLIVEGILEIGGFLHSLSRGWLTRAECNHVARAFLFHHEAYHNAVETFSARLETSYRRPIFIGGLRRRYSVIDPRQPHEEALANAYAARKVRGELFVRERDRRVRQWKRQVAFLAVRRMIALSSPPYSHATSLLPQRGGGFGSAQAKFQEECLLESIGTSIRRLDPAIWDAAPHALHPSLVRNGAYSYVIGRAHPLASRVKASVRYFDRRKFIQRLKEEIAGTMDGGGRHPIYVTSDGRRIPIPNGDLRIGTANSILKQLGLKRRFKTVKEFMAGSR